MGRAKCVITSTTVRDMIDADSVTAHGTGGRIIFTVDPLTVVTLGCVLSTNCVATGDARVDMGFTGMYSVDRTNRRVVGTDIRVADVAGDETLSGMIFTTDGAVPSV